MEAVSRDGVRLAYERTGQRDAETAVLVEGLGYGRWMWNWQRTALADEYDVVLPDNRGTGTSDAPEGPYTVEELAVDLDAVLADAGVDEAHVVGDRDGVAVVDRRIDGPSVLSCSLLLPSRPGSLTSLRWATRTPGPACRRWRSTG